MILANKANKGSFIGLLMAPPTAGLVLTSAFFLTEQGKIKVFGTVRIKVRPVLIFFKMAETRLNPD
jgi:hypothetical protein